MVLQNTSFLQAIRILLIIGFTGCTSINLTSPQFTNCENELITSFVKVFHKKNNDINRFYEVSYIDTIKNEVLNKDGMVIVTQYEEMAGIRFSPNNYRKYLDIEDLPNQFLCLDGTLYVWSDSTNCINKQLSTILISQERIISTKNMTDWEVFGASIEDCGGVNESGTIIYFLRNNPSRYKIRNYSFLSSANKPPLFYNYRFKKRHNDTVSVVGLYR